MTIQNNQSESKEWHVDFTHPAFTRPVARRCITCDGPLDSNQENFCSRFCENMNRMGLDDEI